MRRISPKATAIIVFLFLGILATAVGSTSMVKRNKYLPTEATITRIEEEYAPQEEQHYYATFVKYRVDGNSVRGQRLP